ncbi:phage nozzle protein, partial [Enterobacter hormaechei]
RARADKTPAVGGTALVFSAYGQYGTNYQIIINGVKAAEYKTASGGSASDVETIRTEVIAEQLYTNLLTWAGASAYSISRMG